MLKGEPVLWRFEDVEKAKPDLHSSFAAAIPVMDRGKTTVATTYFGDDKHLDSGPNCVCLVVVENGGARIVDGGQVVDYEDDQGERELSEEGSG
jgi:hypothetical protein